MTVAVDTSDEACAVACMLVSDPLGVHTSDGWKRRVNDLIRALRDERNALRRELEPANGCTPARLARGYRKKVRFGSFAGRINGAGPQRGNGAAS